jgi:hypothetical protein
VAKNKYGLVEKKALKKRHQKRLPSNSFFTKSFLRFEKEQAPKMSFLENVKNFCEKNCSMGAFFGAFFLWFGEISRSCIFCE